MSERFDCKNCNESLGGRKYIQVEDHPHCIPCYDRLYANTCEECKEIIGHNAKELFYENRHYHAHCFRCFRCDRSLADEPFTSQEDALVCSDCYCNEYSSKCVSCDKTVMPGSDAREEAPLHPFCPPSTRFTDLLWDGSSRNGRNSQTAHTPRLRRTKRPTSSCVSGVCGGSDGTG